MTPADHLLQQSRAIHTLRGHLARSGRKIGLRDAEMKLLDRQLAEAADSLALASGSPGVAKTLYEARPS